MKKHTHKNIDISLIIEGLVNFIKDNTKDKKVVLGLSGGIDSSLSVFLAVKALGNDNVKVVIIENTEFTKEGITLAKKFSKKLGVSVHIVTLDDTTNSIIKSLGYSDKITHKQKATIDVRLCDLIIRTIAQYENRLFMGTINGTERLLGWFPKNTLVGDFCPIGGLLKHQLKEIASYLEINSFAEGVSDDASIVCGGCGEHEDFIGLPYKELDNILYEYVSNNIEVYLEQDNKYKYFKFIKPILERIELSKHKNELFPNFYNPN